MRYLNNLVDSLDQILNFSLYNNVQFFYFQSAEIKESGGSFSDDYY